MRSQKRLLIGWSDLQRKYKIRCSFLSTKSPLREGYSCLVLDRNLKLPIDAFTYVFQYEHAAKDTQALKESFRKRNHKEEKKCIFGDTKYKEQIILKVP